MGGSNSSESTATEGATIARNANTVLQQQMSQPDAKRIPNQLIANARCIAVFPSIIQAGLIVGGHHGEGLVTCRQNSGGFKSANPAVYSLSGGSIGLQAGAQKSSVVLLFETKQSVNALLQSKIKLGSQLAVTAGPSGYNHAITDAPAPVVAYVMSQKGLYAGIDLSGSKLTFDQSANAGLYGASATPSGVLLGSMQSAGAMNSFKQTLENFAPSASQNSGGNQQQGQQSDSNQMQNSNAQEQSGANSSLANGDQQQSGMNGSQPGTPSGQSNQSGQPSQSNKSQ
ncbi:MAG: lipid-binding SYLF domain-containing protein [Salinisphaera sp.]|nr:lipid-binding SYLF domain-containing protein [Salinisphaera sp.]